MSEYSTKTRRVRPILKEILSTTKTIEKQKIFFYTVAGEHAIFNMPCFRWCQTKDVPFNFHDFASFPSKTPNKEGLSTTKTPNKEDLSITKTIKKQKNSFFVHSCRVTCNFQYALF